MSGSRENKRKEHDAILAAYKDHRHFFDGMNIPELVCSTHAVKTGEHCKEKPIANLDGYLLCAKCLRVAVEIKIKESKP